MWRLNCLIGSMCTGLKCSHTKISELRGMKCKGNKQTWIPIQSDVTYPKVSYPKSPIIQPWKWEMWLMKVDFLFRYLNKIYNKHLRYLSLWVLDNIPCMNWVKIWVIYTLQNPQGRPYFVNNCPHALLCQLVVFLQHNGGWMCVYRYMQTISCTAQQIALLHVQ